MELKIRYNEHSNRRCDAAFIRGSSAAAWLRVIDRWQLPVQGLLCFILGTKNDPACAEGLLVVFNKGEVPRLGHQAHGYYCVADKLFIPVDAVLVPAVTEQELRALLIWDYQIFHPVFGFTGFEATDGLMVSDLIRFQAPQDVSWSLAEAGPAAFPTLHRIQMEAPTPAEIFEEMKGSINSKDLADIKGPKKDSFLSSFLDPLKRGLLRGGLSIFKQVAGLAGHYSGHSSGVAAGKPGVLASLADWMGNKLEELEKKRDSELKRLVDMFEKDVDEALQFAIPLDSPYLNRGESAPSNTLSRRSTNFSLGNLGGGIRADFWNTDRYEESLRSKYLKAAEWAIANGNYKKAAYVYAHLLGDYRSAARVLEQGKFFREAAALYRDHLKDIPDAAACLERGGLLPDAIELYVQLEQYEKSGDLYLLLNQRANANFYFEKCIGQATDKKDYIEIARIAKEKLEDHPRAESALLTGWQGFGQSESCLTKYFDLIVESDKEQLEAAIQSVYKNETPADKKMSLLNVLVGVKRQYPVEGVQSCSREIAYEVMSEEVKAGNLDSLYILKKFIPDDTLVAGDVNRFVVNFKSRS